GDADHHSADGAFIGSGDFADDDQLHAHRDRAVADAPGAGHATIAAESGDDRAGVVHDVSDHGPDVAAGEFAGASAVYERADYAARGAGFGAGAGAAVHGKANRAEPQRARRGFVHGVQSSAARPHLGPGFHHDIDPRVHAQRVEDGVFAG